MLLLSSEKVSDVMPVSLRPIQSKLRMHRVTYRLLAAISLAALVFYLTRRHAPSQAYIAGLLPGTFLRVPSSPGRLARVDDYRLPDVLDGFSTFQRNAQCSISTLDLHDPIAPLCSTRHELLRAVSSGGRSGLDAPYTPRGCDFRWFTPDELCEVLDRFDSILVIGDSQQRYLTIALHTILRTDLVSGSTTPWDTGFDELEPDECTCEKPFNGGNCMFHVAWSSAVVWDHDPKSFHCQTKGRPNIEFHVNNRFPVADRIPFGIQERVPKVKPKKPVAFVMGGGIWNDLNETATHMWLDQIESAIRLQAPWLDPGEEYGYNLSTSTREDPNIWRGHQDITFPRLFITPSAAGGKKPEMYTEKQGNTALERFERDMGPYLQNRGYDHFGTYNMTIQNTSPDGTHAGMRANLLKAMIVFNWLSMVDLSGWQPGPGEEKSSEEQPVETPADGPPAEEKPPGEQAAEDEVTEHPLEQSFLGTGGMFSKYFGTG